jgi:hypothetical protein
LAETNVRYWDLADMHRPRPYVRYRGKTDIPERLHLMAFVRGLLKKARTAQLEGSPDIVKLKSGSQCSLLFYRLNGLCLLQSSMALKPLSIQGPCTREAPTPGRAASHAPGFLEPERS